MNDTTEVESALGFALGAIITALRKNGASAKDVYVMCDVALSSYAAVHGE